MDVMRDQNRYFFFRKARAIRFQPMYGQAIECVRSSSSNNINIRKIVEGLNHFIEYFYIYDRDTYIELGNYLFYKIVDMFNDVSLLHKEIDENFNTKFYELIEKYITFDEWILSKVCEYINVTSIDNIEDSKASTEVTLDNLNCRIIHVLTVLIKLGYIYNGVLNNTNNKKEDDYLQFMDKIMDNACNVYAKYYPIDRSIDELKSEIHHFFTEFYINKWNKENTDNFCIKFAEFGMSEHRLADEARTILWKAFKKYTPPIADPNDPELMKRYGAANDKELMSVIYNYNCNWDDFKFPNKNLSKFITATYDNIVKRQDSRKETPGVNTIDIVQDSFSQTQKETALYSDKTSFLYTTRIKKAKEIMDMFVLALAGIYKYVLENHGTKTADRMSDFVKSSINTSEDHLFNRLIINKCLIAIVGEYKTYSNLIFGKSNQNILALFYLRITMNPELEFLHKICNIITMNDSKIRSTEYSEIELDHLLKHGDLKITKDDFLHLLNVYVGDSSYTPTIHEVYDILSLLNNPKILRNILFPDQYPIEYNEEEEINPHTEYITRFPIVNELFREYA